MVLPVNEPRTTCDDNDSDGYGNPGNVSFAKGYSRDCNDSNCSINPGAVAVENWTDGIDNDCDGTIDCDD